MSLQDLLRGYPKTGNDDVKAQAPELLVSTVVLTGEVKEVPVRCILFNEDLEIEQAGRRNEDGGQEDGELGHCLLAFVEEAPIVTQITTKKHLLQSTAASRTVISWRRSPDGN